MVVTQKDVTKWITEECKCNECGKTFLGSVLTYPNYDPPWTIRPEFCPQCKEAHKLEEYNSKVNKRLRKGFRVVRLQEKIARPNYRMVVILSNVIDFIDAFKAMMHRVKRWQHNLRI